MYPCGVSRGSSFWLVRLLSWGSTVCCLIVIASFAVFVVNQTGAASQGQLRELGGSVTAGSATAATNGASNDGKPAPKSPLHQWIDEAGETLRAPFSSLTSSHSEWYAMGIGTLLALLLYGFILRFIARSVQVRAKPLG
jgi:hypothetical protein